VPQRHGDGSGRRLITLPAYLSRLSGAAICPTVRMRSIVGRDKNPAKTRVILRLMVLSSRSNSCQPTCRDPGREEERDHHCPVVPSWDGQVCMTMQLRLRHRGINSRCPLLLYKNKACRYAWPHLAQDRDTNTRRACPTQPSHLSSALCVLYLQSLFLLISFLQGQKYYMALLI
jgi:hypothetical protein